MPPSDAVAQMEAANRRADEANRRVDVTLTLLAEANQRADRAEAQAEELRRDLDAARIIAQGARHETLEAVEELRQAEAARRSRLRRAWDAWRGR